MLAEEKLELVMTELLTTEKAYVDDLEFTIANYFIPSFDANIPGFGKEQWAIVFGNIEQVHLQAACFLDSLQEWYPDVGPCFSEISQGSEAIITYCTSFSAADKLLAQASKDNPALQLWLTERQKLTGKGLNLASYLIKPVQRLLKYPLLIREMIKYSSEGYRGLTELEAASEVVQALASQVNEVQREKDQVVKLVESILDMPSPPDVADQLGPMVLESEAEESPQHRTRSKDRHLFLFDRQLVVCKRISSFLGGRDGKQFQYRFALPLAYLAVTGSTLAPLSIEIQFSKEPKEARGWTKPRTPLIVGFPDEETYTTWLNTLMVRVLRCAFSSSPRDVADRSSLSATWSTTSTLPSSPTRSGGSLSPVPHLPELEGQSTPVSEMEPMSQDTDSYYEEFQQWASTSSKEDLVLEQESITQRRDEASAAMVEVVDSVEAWQVQYDLEGDAASKEQLTTLTQQLVEQEELVDRLNWSLEVIAMQLEDPHAIEQSTVQDQPEDQTTSDEEGYDYDYPVAMETEATTTWREGTVLYDFVAEAEGELTVYEGNRVEVMEDTHGDESWLLARITYEDGSDNTGNVPTSYITLDTMDIPDTASESYILDETPTPPEVEPESPGISESPVASIPAVQAPAVEATPMSPALKELLTKREAQAKILQGMEKLYETYVSQPTFSTPEAMAQHQAMMANQKKVLEGLDKEVAELKERPQTLNIQLPAVVIDNKTKEVTTTTDKVKSGMEDKAEGKTRIEQTTFHAGTAQVAKRELERARKQKRKQDERERLRQENAENARKLKEEEARSRELNAKRQQEFKAKREEQRKKNRAMERAAIMKSIELEQKQKHASLLHHTERVEQKIQQMVGKERHSHTALHQQLGSRLGAMQRDLLTQSRDENTSLGAAVQTAKRHIPPRVYNRVTPLAQNWGSKLNRVSASYRAGSTNTTANAGSTIKPRLRPGACPAPALPPRSRSAAGSYAPAPSSPTATRSSRPTSVPGNRVTQPSLPSRTHHFRTMMGNSRAAPLTSSTSATTLPTPSPASIKPVISPRGTRTGATVTSPSSVGADKPALPPRRSRR